MSSFQLYKFADQTLGSWAGGTIRTIYTLPNPPANPPATAANSQIWIGSAVIERAAPYTFFADRLRVHMPLRGQGIRLHFQAPAEVITLASFEQHNFAGARPVEVELINGTVDAFNIIVQPDVAVATEEMRLTDQPTRCRFPRPSVPVALAKDEAALILRLIYAVTGSFTVQVENQPASSLQPDDAVVWHPCAVSTYRDEAIILQSLTPQAEIITATMIFKPS